MLTELLCLRTDFACDRFAECMDWPRSFFMFLLSFALQSSRRLAVVGNFSVFFFCPVHPACSFYPLWSEGSRCWASSIINRSGVAGGEQWKILKEFSLPSLGAREFLMALENDFIWARFATHTNLDVDLELTNSMTSSYNPAAWTGWSCHYLLSSFLPILVWFACWWLIWYFSFLRFLQG